MFNPRNVRLISLLSQRCDLQGPLANGVWAHSALAHGPLAHGPLTLTGTRQYNQNDGNYKVHVHHPRGQSKHKKLQFHKERRDRIVKVEIHDFHEDLDKFSPQELRMKMKHRGIYPVRPWVEKPVHMACTPATFEAYVPPEGDGKRSLATKDGAKQQVELIGKKGKNYLSMRKIYKYNEDFDIKVFAHTAQDIYIKAHNALAAEDEDLLHDLVTERAYPIVTEGTKLKTIRWQFLESVEAPRAVQIRCTDLISDDNKFAQITVRLHTKQTLAVYDRHGHLMHGSEVVGKDVLEYVVFEHHIANTHGKWRIHDKIIPAWEAPRPPAKHTFRLPSEAETKEEDQQEPTDVSSQDASQSAASTPTPAIA